MASKQTEKLDYNRLPEPLKRAIELLKTVKEKALTGVGKHDRKTCPIAKGFEVEAFPFWYFLTKEDAKKLRSLGWTPNSYDSFLQWYDKRDFSPKAKNHNRLVAALLRKELT